MPFTEFNNKSGIVTGEKVLSAFKKCYDYAESVDYWRRFVPEDGKRLDELVALLDCLFSITH